MNRLSGTKVTNYHKKRTANSSGGHGIPKTDTPLVRGETWQIRNVTLHELREVLESKSGSTAGVNEAVRIVEYAIRQSVSEYGTATQEACESAALKCGLDQRGQTRGLGVIKKMLAANPARS